MEHVTEPIVDEFHGWLAGLLDSEGSDLHVKVGSAPMYRMPDGLVRLQRDPLGFDDTAAIADAIVPANRRGRLDEHGEADFAYSVPDVGRFRTNVFRQRGSISMVFRRLRFGGPTFAEIGLPDSVRQIAEEHRGLILVTGPTGSGKTTTLSAMIEHINETKPVHIVTIEDPVEVLYHDKVASINQREVGTDTDDFLAALRAALRQDPDVILIGEMRDSETIDTAMKAAETGHLLVSTLHTPDAVTTVSRIVSMFPPEEQEIARLRLSEALHAVVSQRLLPRADGHGRAAALEVLLATGNVRDMIREKDRTASLHDYIRESREQYGMQTFDQHLMDLVADDVVTYETALAASSNPSDFQLQVKTLRRRSRVMPPTQPTPAVSGAEKPAGLTDDLSGMLPQ